MIKTVNWWKNIPAQGLGFWPFIHPFDTTTGQFQSWLDYVCLASSSVAGMSGDGTDVIQKGLFRILEVGNGNA